MADSLARKLGRPFTGTKAVIGLFEGGCSLCSDLSSATLGFE
jgi:hypothetical protein